MHACDTTRRCPCTICIIILLLAHHCYLGLSSLFFPWGEGKGGGEKRCLEAVSPRLRGIKTSISRIVFLLMLRSWTASSSNTPALLHGLAYARYHLCSPHRGEWG